VAQAYSAAVTDGVFACLADRMAGAMAGAAPVYTYEFNDPNAPAPATLRKVPFHVGASHSLELRYLFEVGGVSPLSPVQQNLSDQMIGYWSQFVSTGVPGMAGAPVWPSINDHLMDRPTMSFEPGGSRVITTFGEDHQCGFWESLGALPGAR
jgi:para-nitrobenzyl esterase